MTTGLVRGKMLLLTAINILVNDAFMGPSRVGNFRILRVLCDGVQILDGFFFKFEKIWKSVLGSLGRLAPEPMFSQRIKTTNKTYLMHSGSIPHIHLIKSP